MATERLIAFALAAILASASLGGAAELPSQSKKSKRPEAAQHCDIAGSPGVFAADGVCIRLSGSISARVNARQLK